jgi:hypothetical protein
MAVFPNRSIFEDMQILTEKNFFQIFFCGFESTLSKLSNDTKIIGIGFNVQKL